MKSTDIYSLFEAQQELFEVNMSPSNLKKLVGTVPNAKVGIEYEMQIPGIFDNSDDSSVNDEIASDIDDVYTFYDNESINDASSLRDELYNNFYSWQSEQISNLWSNDGREYFVKYCRENVTDEEVLEYLGKDTEDEGEASSRDWNDYIDRQWDDQEDIYDNAFYEFEEEVRDDFHDERQFLRDTGIVRMSDVVNGGNYNVSFPSGGGNEAAEELALNFMEYMGLNSVAYANDDGNYSYWEDGYWEEIDEKPYHLYIFESDVSLEYNGPELVGPTQSLDQTLEDSEKIRKWARTNGATSSKQTGLHMNISIPDFSTDKLDYVKLALLLGDQYILDKFDRYGSYYAESALDVVKDRAKDPESAMRLLAQLKTNMNQIASKIIHSGATKKFTSIGTKDNRVEFRAPGGDWLSGSFEKYEDTLRRFVVALDAACDPSKYKKEYESKLHTILTGDKTVKYYDPNEPENRLPGPNGPGTGAVNPVPKKFIKVDDFEGDRSVDQERNFKEYVKKNRKNLRTYIPNDKALDNFSKVMAGEISTKQYIQDLEKAKKERLRGSGIRILQPDEIEENDWEITYDDDTKSESIYIANTDTVPDDEAAFNAAKKFKPKWFKPDTIEYITIKPYKFDEALNDLKLYAANYRYKNLGVVAKDEEQAKEFIRIMDPEWFSANPETEIELTDENETSKKKLKQMNDWVQNKLESGREWIARPKIWKARGTASEPAFLYNYSIAATTRDDALAVLARSDSGFRIQDLYVSDSYPSDATYEAQKTAQEDIIRQQDEDRIQRQAAQDETIDVSNLKGYRVSNSTDSTIYRYIVAENGAEAAEIASKIEPEYFPDITAITVQDAGSMGAETLIRGMYARQQAQLSKLPTQQTPAPSTPSNTRISDFRTYTVTNTETGQARRFAATSEEDAINIGRREYPALFSTGNITATQSS